jgi:methylmalonyl-CoA/ethylmalonyl-CoA epimerase
MSHAARSDNPNILGIKHMAFAVSDAEAARASYARFLCVPADAPIFEYAASRNRVAIFDLGGVEYQLCQSMDADGRFASWIARRGGEGLHHICYAVDDIGKALDHAQANGASLRECKPCKAFGSHPHPEGFVAFLDNDAGGIEIEFMQVYTPEELERYRQVKGI